MQDAFGGTFMLKLFMVFFVIYVAFIGVALNFAKIYRIKNNVINILERYEYNGKDAGGEDGIHSKLETYLKNVPYENPNIKLSNRCDENFTKLGICVVKKGEEDKPYYKVTVYYVVNLPVLDIPGIVVTASGETIVIDT